ncbi:MAG: substrate-binding domain-containing protein [Alphaproteobacteria bacterium]|nr:substrate-binding domain-containing protein [Alphaproteobacteria bacterium]
MTRRRFRRAENPRTTASAGVPGGIPPSSPPPRAERRNARDALFRPTQLRRRWWLVALVGATLLCCGGSAAAQTADIASRTVLKVCADPSDLPFSDEKKEGFENKIAELMGASLGVKVEYTWFPQIIGFVRNTLAVYRCDLVMGTVAGDEIMTTTNPYYFTTYVMVYRSDKRLVIEDMRDPLLKSLRLGVVSATPPADLLVSHDLMARTKPYPLTVDTRVESPTHQMVLDVMSGAIDVGFLWGPIAGYYKEHDKLPLTLVPLADEPGAPRMKYHIAMGVRANEPEWRRRINAVILKQQPQITAILRDYGVPLLNEQGQLADP